MKDGKIAGNSLTFAAKSLQVFADSVLMATAIGVNYLNHDLKIAGAVWDDRATVAYRNNSGTYIGTLQGLYILDATGHSWHMGKLHPALNRRIAALCESKNGTLWIATNGEGVIGYKDGKIITALNEKNGLTSNICRAAFCNNNDLWIGTDKGLNKIEPDTGNKYKITTYTREDGLIDNAINALYIEGSFVYVGTPAGLSYFDEDKVMTNSSCILNIIGIQSARRYWPFDTSGIRFSHNENNIRFNYAGISYKSAGDITYRYRLLGLDDTWQTTTNNFLNYPTLPSGEYVLQVKATNKFGVESDMATVSFTIEKLLWEKTWFRVALIILAGIVIWIFIHYRIRQIRKQETDKTETGKKMAELEQMALKAQMNPHFIFNSLNSIQQYVIDKDIRGANRFITGFSQLVRLTLDFSSVNSISLQEEINYISTYLSLEQAKFESKFTYRILLDDRLDLTAHQIPPMILQPYIENSIRHGVRYRKDVKGLITVSFRINGQYLQCSIEDNGVGRKTSGALKGNMPIEYQSKGMTHTARRIEMMNANSKNPILIEIDDLYHDQNASCGTRVIVRFPIN